LNGAGSIPALRRLAPSWWWGGVILGVNAAVWVPLTIRPTLFYDVCDRFPWRWMTAQPQAPWDRVDLVLSVVGYPLLLVTLPTLIYLGSRVVAPLLRELDPVPRTKWLRKRMLYPKSVWVPLLCTLSVMQIGTIRVGDLGDYGCLFMWHLPPVAAAVVTLDRLRAHGKLAARTAWAAQILVWASLAVEPFKSVWMGLGFVGWFVLSPILLALWPLILLAVAFAVPDED
jgi:hypothetical protein